VPTESRTVVVDDEQVASLQWTILRSLAFVS